MDERSYRQALGRLVFNKTAGSTSALDVLQRYGATTPKVQDPGTLPNELFASFTPRAFELARSMGLSFIDERLLLMALMELQPALSETVLGVSIERLKDVYSEIEHSLQG